VDGVSLNVVDYAGRASDELPPLLLLHGGMAHARWFDFLAPLLAGAYRPLALDRRGHGDSEWTEPERYGWERDLADTVEAMRRLDPGPWSVAGHSQGGLLAAHLAARRPDLVVSLVLLDVPLHPGGPRLRRTGEALRKVPQLRWPSLDDAVRSFRPFPAPHRVPPDVLDHLARASFRPTGDGAWTSKFHWKTFQAPRPDGGSPLSGFAEEVRAIAAPTLCVRGSESSILSAEEHAEMARRIPLARAVEIPETTHNLHVEDPAAVAAEILAFAGATG
jgi:pimeloyl-ACP methyl ester carboxylesterase